MNPGYRTYNNRRPNAIYGGTAMLVRSNIQHVEVKIPMMSSLQVTAIMVELEGLKTVIGALYRSPCIPFVKADLDTLIGLSKSKKFIFGGDLNAKHQEWNSRLTTLSGRLLSRHADRNQYACPYRIVLLTIPIGSMRTLTCWTNSNIIRCYLWNM